MKTGWNVKTGQTDKTIENTRWKGFQLIIIQIGNLAFSEKKPRYVNKRETRDGRPSNKLLGRDSREL